MFFLSRRAGRKRAGESYSKRLVCTRLSRSPPLLLIAVQSAAEARIALSTRGRAKRQQRALRASLRGAALTARARQRSEAGRASASISSNHALFTLSPPGHGPAAGGSNAGPQDSVRRPRAKHVTAVAAARRRPTDADASARATPTTPPRPRVHAGSARRSSGPSRRCLSTWYRARSPSTASRPRSRTTRFTGCASFSQVTGARSWS